MLGLSYLVMNFDHFKAVLGILCHVVTELEESVTFVDAQGTSVLNVFVVVRFEILAVVNRLLSFGM
jgi:hypothetical protein